MLFVELALIRWTGSNVVYLSYFSNFVLLGSFLGIGLGFMRAGARRNLWPWAPAVLAALVVFVRQFPVTIDRSGSQLIYFGGFETTGLPPWITLPAIFLAVALVMMTIGEGVARTFARFEPLEAYRLDILGSIAGIAAFTAISFFRAPPVVWASIAALLFAALLWRPGWIQVASLVLLVGILTAESLAAGISWSPYYKVSVEDIPTRLGPVHDIHVNGIPHQTVQSIERRRASEPIYFLPYKRATRADLDEVLIVGAGNGSDVAIALDEGAAHVDAVEIDPRLAQLGRELHPDRPYSDDRVDLHVDDGRAFLHGSDTEYDLILFALPDSLTLVSGQSSLRLESYLFTKQAFQEAKDHLAPDGVFALYNFFREPWLVKRLARTLDEVYGRPPCVDSVFEAGGLAMLTASPTSAALRCQPTTLDLSVAPEPASDDYPFLYLRSRSLPGFYLLAIGLILLASLALVRVTGGPLRGLIAYLDLFFMGAAFLLLETKSVVQFALLFGTTWLVNALVFAGILLTVLAAIEVAQRKRFERPELLYAALFVAIVVAAAIPYSAFLGLHQIPRFVVSVLVTFAPIFLANLVFAERFRQVGSSTLAFGANLLGAMVGGLLEYLSLVTGYRALLLVTALLYGTAFVLGRRTEVMEPA